MKPSWKKILLTAAILTAGFSCELLLAVKWGVRDERMLVLIGSGIMGVAVLVAGIFNARPPPDRMV